MIATATLDFRVLDNLKISAPWRASGDTHHVGIRVWVERQRSQGAHEFEKERRMTQFHPQEATGRLGYLFWKSFLVNIVPEACPQSCLSRLECPSMLICLHCMMGAIPFEVFRRDEVDVTKSSRIR